MTRDGKRAEKSSDRPQPVIPGSGSTIRAFVALELPPAARAWCAAAIEQARRALGPSAGMVRWVDPTGLHLTLKFLGAVPAVQVGELSDRLAAAVASQPAFSLAIGALGLFPSQRAPRVIWLGLMGDLAELHACQERVERAMERLGYPREKRAFTPHLTLGRVRETAPPDHLAAIGQLPSSLPPTVSPPFRVTSISLIQSVLGPGGATYYQLAEQPFEV